jgi:hypothetical protein
LVWLAAKPILPAVVVRMKRRLDKGLLTFYCELRGIEALNNVAVSVAQSGFDTGGCDECVVPLAPADGDFR